jgi:hypothetical protein
LWSLLALHAEVDQIRSKSKAKATVPAIGQGYFV